MMFPFCCGSIEKRKWQGTYLAHVLNVTDAGIRIKHLEDDFEETLPLDALGGGKYRLEPVDSDEEDEAPQAGEGLWMSLDSG